MNLKEFQKDSIRVNNHANLADDSFLNETFDVALLEMLRRGKDGKGPDALTQQYKQQGAMEFLSIWRSLSFKPETVETEDTGKLTYPTE